MKENNQFVCYLVFQSEMTDTSTEEDECVEEEIFAPAAVIAQASCSAQKEFEPLSSQPSTSHHTPNRWSDPRPEFHVLAPAIASSVPSTSSPNQNPNRWQNDYESYINLIHETTDDEDDDLYSAVIASIEDQT